MGQKAAGKLAGQAGGRAGERREIGSGAGGILERSTYSRKRIDNLISSSRIAGQRAEIKREKKRTRERKLECNSQCIT